jgi:hypothetical protein
MTHSDDYARVLEILAMTANEGYPLKSPTNNNYPFSFYYASLYPYAILKLLFNSLTIKSIIGWVSIFYYTLLLFSILEIAKGVLRSRIKIRFFLFFVTLFGGLDWAMSENVLRRFENFVAPGNIFSMSRLFSLSGHFEWWQQISFNGNTQVSSFFTSLFWAPHHFISAYCALLAFFIMFYSWCSWSKSFKYFSVMALLSASFYSSPFAFLPVILFLTFHVKLIFRKFINPLALFVIIISIPPLYIFLSKLPSETFILSTFHLKLFTSMLANKIASFPIYVTLVPLIELAGLPIFILFFWKILSKQEKVYTFLAWIYFLSTYVIAYSGSNNYSMRGMLVPSFVFFFIAARHSQVIIEPLSRTLGKYFSLSILALIIFLSIGTVEESIGRLDWSLKMTNILRPIPSPAPSIYQTAIDKTISTIDFDDIKNVPRTNIYDFEKPIVGLGLEKMQNFEKELIRKP